VNFKLQSHTMRRSLRMVPPNPSRSIRVSAPTWLTHILGLSVSDPVLTRECVVSPCGQSCMSSYAWVLAQLMKLENAPILVPHPRTKGSIRKKDPIFSRPTCPHQQFGRSNTREAAPISKAQQMRNVALALISVPVRGLDQGWRPRRVLIHFSVPLS
jgi:hypothetical protein